MFSALLLALFFASDPKPERVTYRAVGLFAPGRVAALKSAWAGVADIKLIEVNYDEAELTVEFAPAKLFPGQKPERVAELVSERVGVATNHTIGVKPRRTVPRDKLKEVTIAASGCDCKGCNLAAYEAVAAVDGVYRATASFKDSKVTVLFDPAKTDAGKLEDALRKKGVTVGKR